MKPKPIGTIIARVRERQRTTGERRAKAAHDDYWIEKEWRMGEALDRVEARLAPWRALPWWRRLIQAP